MAAPAILFLDIETAPDVAWVWGVYEQNAIAVKEHWYILSYAAKWRGEDAIETRGLVDYPGYKGGSSCESDLLDSVWSLLDRADIVVAHNGSDFDVKKLNAKFIQWDFDPPSPYKVVDTKRDLTRVARFSSNKLDWLCKQLELGSKMETGGFDTWQGCMNGDREAWAKMKEYNANDIVLLESLYETLAPWIRQPNAALFHDGEEIRCANPACGSESLTKRGTQHALTRSYQRYQCNDCGAWTRSAKSVKAVKSQRAV